jgi:hypothetical protein
MLARGAESSLRQSLCSQSQVCFFNHLGDPKTLAGLSVRCPDARREWPSEAAENEVSLREVKSVLRRVPHPERRVKDDTVTQRGSGFSQRKEPIPNTNRDSQRMVTV